jgi:hypothetical protein
LTKSKKDCGCCGGTAPARKMSTMLPNEVYNLLCVPSPLSAEASLRKTWLSTQSRPCKDVIALALPLRRVPTTLEDFKHSLAENSKGSDWIISTWYVVYVDAADGREWGWSKAPYDTKKRLPDAKASTARTPRARSWGRRASGASRRSRTT